MKKKGEKLVNQKDGRVATVAADLPFSYGKEQILELIDDSTGDRIELVALDRYAEGWTEPIPCFDCKAWAPFGFRCDDCQAKFELEREAKVRAAIEAPEFSHARARSFGSSWELYIYHRDPSSPSGVHLVAQGPEAVVEPILREKKRPGALSPTEGLGRG